MEKRVVISHKRTAAGVFSACPICKAGKLLRLYPETSAAALPVFCRRCKRVIVLDIQPGEWADRVTLRRID